MHSALAGGPHFLAHNLLLPFPVLQQLTGESFPGCRTLLQVYDPAKINLVLLVCFFFCFSSFDIFFQAYQDETTFSLVLVLFAAFYVSYVMKWIPSTSD